MQAKNSSVQQKKTVIADINITAENSDRKVMQTLS